jgi:hypothetical protein
MMMGWHRLQEGQLDFDGKVCLVYPPQVTSVVPEGCEAGAVAATYRDVLTERLVRIGLLVAGDDAEAPAPDLVVLCRLVRLKRGSPWGVLGYHFGLVGLLLAHALGWEAIVEAECQLGDSFGPFESLHAVGKGGFGGPFGEGQQEINGAAGVAATKTSKLIERTLRAR